MIVTDRAIKIHKGVSTIDEPVIVYRGDYEVTIRFTITSHKFKFMSGVNMIESEKASYAQLAILTPYGGNVFSDMVRCSEGAVAFVMSKELMDQIEEVGLYSFQIRLFDGNRESRISIPPVEFGLEIREPVASEDHDNEVNNAIVGYSIAKVVDPSKEDVGDTFNDNGEYNKTDWETGDRISEGKLNKIEDAIDKLNQNEKTDVAALDKRVTNNFNVLDNTKAELSDLEVLETRVDSLAHLQEGSTTGDAELIDARIEYNGVVNSTVGGAIRNQISNIHDTLDIIVNKSNLYSTAPVVQGKYFDYGTEREGAQYSYFKVEVQGGVTYYMHPGIRLYCMMNYSGEVVDRSNEEHKEMFSYTPSVSGFLYVTVYTNRLKTSKMATTSDMDSVGNYGEAFTLSDKISMYGHKDIEDIYNLIGSYFISNNLLDDAPYYPNYFHRQGYAVTNDIYSYFIVDVNPGTEYVVYPRCRMVDWYNIKDECVSFDESIENKIMPVLTVPSSDNIVKAYITVYNSDIDEVRVYENDGRSHKDVNAFNSVMLHEKVYVHDIGEVSDMRDDITKLQTYVIDNNLLTYSPCVDGYYFNSNSTIIADRKYCYYKVDLKADVTYHMYPRIRIVRAYRKGSSDSIFFSDKECNTGEPYEFTPNMDCEAYITFFSSDKNIAFISEESDPDLVSKTGTISLNPNIVVESADTANRSNILYKKKWAVIGDSFTAGDFNGYTDANGLTGKNSPELYDAELGMYKTYPWWIMKRNDMILQKFYQGGRTLATPADGTFTNSITYNDMYKQIDPDVDYITIYLGINDGHHMPGTTGDDGEDTSGSIPIGTETDETTATFYGAWNVLLRDLITLYPFAHIGILVSNGMDTDEHVNATIKMAKKWGIPYLNLDSGYDVPLLIRSRPNCRPETCAEAIELRRNQQRVSSSNGHPNHLAHKYESTFIEDFLRRI